MDRFYNRQALGIDNSRRVVGEVQSWVLPSPGTFLGHRYPRTHTYAIGLNHRATTATDIYRHRNRYDGRMASLSYTTTSLWYKRLCTEGRNDLDVR